MQVQLRMNYEMNSQLLADSDLSLGDYHVLSALSEAPGERMRMSSLATYIGWELSRLSHHTSRMAKRDLIERLPSESDRRATDVRLTAFGRKTIRRAAPAHVALVRRLFFGGLPKHLRHEFQQALSGVYESLIRDGTLAAPPHEV
jgi:DNA-binding MarR family transcriptional regulator